MKKLCLFGGKSFVVVWLDAEKCKPDCSFTSFWCTRWFTFFETKLSPSENANWIVDFNHTMLDEKKKQKRKSVLCCSSCARFHFRHKPPLPYFEPELCHLEIFSQSSWPQKPQLMIRCPVHSDATCCCCWKENVLKLLPKIFEWAVRWSKNINIFWTSHTF